MPDPILEIRGLNAGYGDFQALFDVSFSLSEGRLLAIIGANGAGKSTLMKAVTGLIPVPEETVFFRGQDIGRSPPQDIARLGIAMVPEGRRLFRSLSVEENLLIGAESRRPGEWSLERIFALFPILQEKRKLPGTSLSGGQQQMVAIGRALMSNPDLLLCDEISLGLAPIVVRDIYQALPEVMASGVSVILVEQDITRALSEAQRFICMQEGRVSLAGQPSDFDRDEIAMAYFGS